MKLKIPFFYNLYKKLRKTNTNTMTLKLKALLSQVVLPDERCLEVIKNLSEKLS
jgi:hypothetical protein